jgi:hypothetical protein
MQHLHISERVNDLELIFRAVIYRPPVTGGLYITAIHKHFFVFTSTYWWHIMMHLYYRTLQNIANSIVHIKLDFARGFWLILFNEWRQIFHISRLLYKYEHKASSDDSHIFSSATNVNSLTSKVCEVIMRQVLMPFTDTYKISWNYNRHNWKWNKQTSSIHYGDMGN